MADRLVFPRHGLRPGLEQLEGQGVGRRAIEEEEAHAAVVLDFDHEDRLNDTADSTLAAALGPVTASLVFGRR